MAQRIQIKRGTRAQLDAAATAIELFVGEPYLITDENRIAVGLTTSTYEVYSKGSEGIDPDLLASFTALGTVIDASTTALPAGAIRSDYTVTGPASGAFTLNITHAAAAGKAMSVFGEVDNSAGASLGIQVNGVTIPTADWNITPSWGVKFRFEVYVSTSGIHNATWDKVGD